MGDSGLVSPKIKFVLCTRHNNGSLFLNQGFHVGTFGLPHHYIVWRPQLLQLGGGKTAVQKFTTKIAQPRAMKNFTLHFWWIAKNQWKAKCNHSSRMPVMQFGSSQMSHLGQVRLRGTLHLKADYFLSETEFNYIYVYIYTLIIYTYIIYIYIFIYLFIYLFIVIK